MTNVDDLLDRKLDNGINAQNKVPRQDENVQLQSWKKTESLRCPEITSIVASRGEDQIHPAIYTAFKSLIEKKVHYLLNITHILLNILVLN